MEQTASRAFKAGAIDRRAYLLLIKGFSGDELDAEADDDFAALDIDRF